MQGRGAPIGIHQRTCITDTHTHLFSQPVHVDHRYRCRHWRLLLLLGLALLLLLQPLLVVVVVLLLLLPNLPDVVAVLGGAGVAAVVPLPAAAAPVGEPVVQGEGGPALVGLVVLNPGKSKGENV